MEFVLPAGKFSFLANNLALDFANTLDWRLGDRLADRLQCYADLVAWGRDAGLLDEGAARGLVEEAAGQPDAARRVLEEARRLREAILGIFDAVIAGLEPGRDDMAALNAALAKALPHLRVVRGEQGFAWAWEPAPGSLDSILWPLARASADLLVSDELDRVRVCSDDSCGWLFIDTTRNRSRQWCSMETCGNRAKARRHYHKERTDAG